MAKSSQSAVVSKPAKPYEDFPLYAHATKRWAKRVRGKIHYFAPWSDPDGALTKWLDQKDALLAGRTPRVSGNGLAVRDLLEQFMVAKDALVESGEITKRTRDDYLATCTRIANAFGRTRLVDDLATDDFGDLRATIAAKWGPVALGNEINRVRVVFKYGYDAGLLDKPMRFGPNFKRPSRKTLRKERAKKGPRLFEPGDIKRLAKAASVQLRAMILLGINCGFGNADVGALTISALDLKNGWVNYPRPKTGIDRRCRLWPETVKALDAVLKAGRPDAKDDAHKDLVFVTRCGNSWHKTVADSPVTKETRKLLDELGIYRPGLGFYALRHTFETIGGETADQVAVNAIMGHVDSSMAGAYRERISDERLVKVAEFVRTWLYAKAKPTAAQQSRPTKSGAR